MPSSSTRPSLSLRLNICYVTVQFTSPSSPSYVPILLWTADTCVNMYDSESSLKEGASDLGFDLATGGLPHKREFARIVTAWKTAKVMAETKLQTDTVARAHGVPVTLYAEGSEMEKSETTRRRIAGKRAVEDDVSVSSKKERLECTDLSLVSPSPEKASVETDSEL